MCDIIIIAWFQLSLNFVTFEVTRLKFPMSGINVSALHPSFSLPLKKGIINQVFREKLGWLYSHVQNKILEGILERVHNPYLILSKDMVFISSWGGDLSDVRNMCLLISVKISLHLLKLWASERFALQKGVRNAHSLKDGFVLSNPGVKCNLLSYQNSGVHGLVSGHRRWTAVLHLLCFQCSFDRAWEKTGEVRNWD